MTNREWLNTLATEEFIAWLLYDEYFDLETCKTAEPTPKLSTIKKMGTLSEYSLKEWLEAERKENGQW